MERCERTHANTDLESAAAAEILSEHLILSPPARFLSAKRMVLIVKRAMDVIFSLAGLILHLPVFVVAALAGRLDSRGHVIRGGQRSGKEGGKGCPTYAASL